MSKGVILTFILYSQGVNVVYKKITVSDYRKINKGSEVKVSKKYLNYNLFFLLVMCLWNSNIGYVFLFLYFVNYIFEKMSDYYFLVGFSLLFSFGLIVSISFLMFIVELFFSSK
ncbi:MULTISPECIES: hypothetical protein [Acinetobacter]|uniref:Uncharacterized protein n=1 Tax=Acinetobacter higginsii TaxID=70347 RepID=N9RM86_9GAMM|nr:MULTISPECIES: hypothetical protein [Acinetobacter]MCJ0830463.1 hypothetical protein [Acinetobacter sp. NIPH1876]ENX59058.1 hypothetical protein F902_01689 [Acinetobacter higginsii]ENX59701.1 hypothetical protein F885_02578 [Acinetobacter higginsii]MCH7318488.1 hypothetical protein [Acinetobacter higginsii]MCH7338689.1 hypothetical protein [Acinetobacter higginsii]